MQLCLCHNLHLFWQTWSMLVIAVDGNKESEGSKIQLEMRRAVSEEQKKSLESKLKNFMTKLRDKSVKPVLYPNIFFEFGKPQIAQIIQSCYHIFSIEDIQNTVEISRTEHSKGSIVSFYDVFQDMADVEAEIGECDNSIDISSKWREIRDDSDMNLSINETKDVSMISEHSATMSELDDSNQTVTNRSSLLNTLAVEASYHIHMNMKDNMES